MGGNVKSVTSIRQCQAALQGFSVEEVQACLEAEASVNMKVNVKVEAKHCKKDVEKTASKSSFSSLFSDRYTTSSPALCHLLKNIFIILSTEIVDDLNVSYFKLFVRIQETNSITHSSSFQASLSNILFDNLYICSDSVLLQLSPLQIH